MCYFLLMVSILSEPEVKIPEGFLQNKTIFAQESLINSHISQNNKRLQINTVGMQERDKSKLILYIISALVFIVLLTQIFIFLKDFWLFFLKDYNLYFVLFYLVSISIFVLSILFYKLLYVDDFFYPFHLAFLVLAFVFLIIILIHGIKNFLFYSKSNKFLIKNGNNINIVPLFNNLNKELERQIRLFSNVQHKMEESLNNYYQFERRLNEEISLRVKAVNQYNSLTERLYEFLKIMERLISTAGISHEYREAIWDCRKYFDKVLSPLNISTIIPNEGDDFDPMIHEVVGEVETLKVKPGKIAKVVSWGFRTPQLIERAKVILSKQSNVEEDQKTGGKNES